MKLVTSVITMDRIVMNIIVELLISNNSTHLVYTFSYDCQTWMRQLMLDSLWQWSVHTKSQRSD